MSCKITEYTTVGAVRGCLGLTDNEVTDDMVVDQNLNIDLTLDLDGWLPTHAALWDAAFAAGATAEDKRYGSIITMYSQWYCAVRVCEMWLAMPQRISDGKSDMRRFAEIDFDRLLELAVARMMKFRALLEGEVLELDPRGHSLLAVSAPSYDPVTGSES